MVRSPQPGQQGVVAARLPRMHLVLAFSAFVLIGGNDAALGVLIPSMRLWYRSDAVTISWLFLCFAAGYLVVTFNNGLLMATLGERRHLLLGLGLFVLGAGVCSLRPPFLLFLCAGAQLGMGVGIMDAGLNAYIATLPANAALLNYLHAFYGVGALLGPLLASTLLTLQLGWQATYLVWCILALLLLSGFWLTFLRVPRACRRTAMATARSPLLQAVRLRSVWLAAFFLLFYTGTEVTVGNWGYSFLTLARSGSLLLSAWVVSGYWCGLTLGRLLLATLTARLGVQRMIALCLAGVIPGLLLVWLLPFWGVAPGFCLIGFSLGPLYPTTIVFAAQVVTPRQLPGVVGFLACLGSVGASFFPWLAGNAFQHLGFWFLPPFALLLTTGMLGICSLLTREPSGRA
jgi:fucose permease